MDDLISRQAAIDELSFCKEMLNRALDDMDLVGTEREKFSWGLGLIESNIYDIEGLPSAQPERKRGHWTSDGNCSECGEHAPFWAMASTYHTTPYCYNCGAKMKGETDETD